MRRDFTRNGWASVKDEAKKLARSGDTECFIHGSMNVIRQDKTREELAQSFLDCTGRGEQRWLAGMSIRKHHSTSRSFPFM